MRTDSEFSKSPEFRMEVFHHPPPPAVCHPFPQTFEEFLRLRKWLHVAPDTPEYRLLTQALSYPLTLSHLLRLTSSSLPSPLNRLNICCVGARAESSLMMPWWKEMIMFNMPAPEVNILMVGPETMNARKEKAKVVFEHEHVSLKQQRLAQQQQSETAASHVSPPTYGHSSSSSDPSFSPFSFPKKRTSSSPFYQTSPTKTQQIIIKKKPSRALFHQRRDAKAILDHTHVFVLFNPGLSYPWHNEGWGESLDMIVKSKKPILFSAPSKEDMQRDLQVIKKRYKDSSIQWIVNQIPNPFKSGRRSLTQIKEAFEVVLANQMIYALQMV